MNPTSKVPVQKYVFRKPPFWWFPKSVCASNQVMSTHMCIGKCLAQTVLLWDRVSKINACDNNFLIF